MQSLKQNKLLIILFIISLVAYLIYQFGGSLTPTEDPALLGGGVEDAIVQDIVVLLDQMQQARIDTELFTATSWTSLVDYSITLPQDTPGRPELFDGVLRGNTSLNTATPVATSTTPTIQR